MFSVKINDDECVDLLTKNQLKIIQKKEGFRFSLDSVLLASFCQLKNKNKIIDLGTGTAIIPLTIINNAENLSIIGVEIIPEIADMAVRSVKMNHLESNITIINYDLKKINEHFKTKSFDIVISNPPYHAIGSGNINPNHIKAIARHEIACTLEDVIKSANYLLNEQGKFFIILKPHRMFELHNLLKKHNFFIQKIRFVHPHVQEKANSVLVQIMKKNKKTFEIMMPLIVFDQKGNYTEELQQIYNQ